MAKDAAKDAPKQDALKAVTKVAADDAIRCDACPVLCYIKPGRTIIIRSTPGDP